MPGTGFRPRHRADKKDNALTMGAIEMSKGKRAKGQSPPKKQDAKKEQKTQSAADSHAEDSQKKSLETYEISRESTLITQAGLQSALFSFLTSAVFTAWPMGIEYFTRIPKRWFHFLAGVVTFCLVLSLLGSVLALFFTPSTRKKEITYEIIKKNNNCRVTLLKGSLAFFVISILIIIFASWIIGGMYYDPIHELF